MIDMREKVDILLHEAKEAALCGGDGQGEIAGRLLRTAKTLIEIAEEVLKGNGPHASAAIPLGIEHEIGAVTHPVGKRRTIDSVSPVVQQNLAATFYRIRRARDEVFDRPELFADPAWDMILDLLVAERKNKSISVTSACAASGVPPTTALRWLNVLESRGYVDRTEDKMDRRRHFISLTDKTRRTMNQFFVRVSRFAPL